MKKIKRWLMWKWYIFYLHIYERHMEGDHYSDFEICHNWLCRLIAPFDRWYVGGDNWFYYNKKMNSREFQK